MCFLLLPGPRTGGLRSVDVGWQSNVSAWPADPPVERNEDSQMGFLFSLAASFLSFPAGAFFEWLAPRGEAMCRSMFEHEQVKTASPGEISDDDGGVLK